MEDLIHPGIDHMSTGELWGRPLFRNIESRVDSGPLYVSVCHGSHRTVFSLASRILGASEYPGRVTGQGKAKEIPRLSTWCLPTRTHQWYLSGSVSTTKPASHQHVSRIVLRNKRRSTSIGQVGSCSVAQSLVSVVSFGAARGQGRTLGLVLLDSAMAEW
jgi:hypothetical protein